MRNKILALVFFSLAGQAFAQQKTDYTILPSLVKEAKEKGNVRLADSLAQDYINNYLFKLKKEELMKKDNLLFVSQNMKSTDTKGFAFFFNQRDKINSVLGTNQAEYAIRSAIAMQFIPKNVGEYSATVWENIERTVTTKFGDLGQEMVYGRRMIYCKNNNDWKNFGKYYKAYFEKALKRPEYNINVITWPLFENVDDPKILKFACDVVMKYAIEEWYSNNSAAYDTYANLLYKTGRNDLAIMWEKKALKIDPNDNLIKISFDKMKKGLPTWNEISTNP